MDAQRLNWDIDDYKEMLSYIDPDEYDDWVKIGMALKHEGMPLGLWDAWAANSTKYHPGDCEKKWNTFNESAGGVVTGGTIYHLAQTNGWKPQWKEISLCGELPEIGMDYGFVNASFARESFKEPDDSYDPVADMKQYLRLLFKEDEIVGYCTSFAKREDGRITPKTGTYTRTAGSLLKALSEGGIAAAFGSGATRNEGAFIRFNPLDGNGEGNSNVTDRRYCLIECDDENIPPETQYAIIKELQLPVKVLVYSGNKSIHAITHVDAANEKQYRERVNYIYEICEKNGLKPDPQDKNESRYSRLPGVRRGDKWQHIIDSDIGFGSYDEWHEYIESLNDNLPKDVTLADIWNDMPPLADELIKGVLRQGHKLLLAGPSKAGKSFLLMGLCVSIAEGIPWLGLECQQGKVAYVNLELDSASCFHRFKDIYEKRGIVPKHLTDIQVWNLRGYAAPMDKLAPFLIRRFKSKGYKAVIIDPLYKILTGDENSASEMAEFCSYFDKVATDLGVSVIYCHHHSKGAVGKYANAADRSSGSGVFARDPDAILDLTELKLEQGAVERYRNENPKAVETLTGWELSGTLREFPPLNMKRLWFDYPVHILDEWNYLASAKYAKGTGGAVEPEMDPDEIAESILLSQPDDVNAVTAAELGYDTEDTAKKAKFKKYRVSKGDDGIYYVFKKGENALLASNGKRFRVTNRGLKEI